VLLEERFRLDGRYVIRPTGTTDTTGDIRICGEAGGRSFQPRSGRESQPALVSVCCAGDLRRDVEYGGSSSI
jgi:hypothetical protein